MLTHIKESSETVFFAAEKKINMCTCINNFAIFEVCNHRTTYIHKHFYRDQLMLIDNFKPLRELLVLTYTGTPN